MTKIVFYEKPGCANNARQKALLRASGHEVEARSLLSEAWTPERLRSFFGDRPVNEWFNRAAPRVKSGEIRPEAIAAETALALMIADPLLIRRPLLEAGGRRETGFDAALIDAWVGLRSAEAAVTEACLRPQSDSDAVGCPPPGKETE